MKRLVLSIVLAACGGPQQNSDTLGDAIRSYNEGVRWGRYTVAATNVPARERAQFIEDMDERGERVKITEYDVVDVNARSSREARVRIKIGWYADDEGTFHETHAVQTWERQGKAWFMVGEQRVRGREMPGLPEPVDGDSPGSGSPDRAAQSPQDPRTSRR